MKMHEFKLSHLFNISTTISQNKNNITFNKKGKYDFIGRSSVDYGVQGHLDEQSFSPNPANTFSLVQVGESVCLYREKKWYASQNIFILKAKDIRIMNNHLYVSTLINKQLSIYSLAYDYPTLQKVKDIIILLPVIENSDENHEYTVDDIDFEYMEDYISQLETERISQLETYLSCTGLDDYELTDEDREVLSREVEMREFVLGDIFEKKTVKGIPKKNENLAERIEGYHIFGQNIKYQHPQKILADEKYLQKVNAKYPILAYTSSVGEIGMIEESFYRSGDNGAFQGLFPKCEIELLPMHYILTILKKHFNSFDYSTSMQKIMDLKILLPIIPHTSPFHTYTIEDIDFDYMEKYIRAIEKQTIKGVYEGSGRVIEKTKEIVG